jgi:hypothetical protein
MLRPLALRRDSRYNLWARVLHSTANDLPSSTGYSPAAAKEDQAGHPKSATIVATSGETDSHWK